METVLDITDVDPMSEGIDIHDEIWNVLFAGIKRIAETPPTKTTVHILIPELQQSTILYSHTFEEVFSFPCCRPLKDVQHQSKLFLEKDRWLQELPQLSFYELVQASFPHQPNGRYRLRLQQPVAGRAVILWLHQQEQTVRHHNSEICRWQCYIGTEKQR